MTSLFCQTKPFNSRMKRIPIRYLMILVAIIFSTISFVSEANPVPQGGTKDCSNPVVSEANSVPQGRAKDCSELDPNPIFYALIAIVLLAYYAYIDFLEKKETDPEIKKKNYGKFFIDNYVFGIGSIVFSAIMHYIGGSVIGHDIWATILLVGMVVFIEKQIKFLRQLPATIDKKIQEAVPNSLNSKRFFVTGTTHSDDLNKMLLYIDELDQFKENKVDGISMFRFHATAGDYAKVCRHFLAKASSIESITDMDLDKLLVFFQYENGHVMTWVKDVNRKVSEESPTSAYRVLVLTKERYIFLTALETLSDETGTISDKEKSSAKDTIKAYSRLPSTEFSNEDFEKFILESLKGFKNFLSYYCKLPDKNYLIEERFKFRILVKPSHEIGAWNDFIDGPQFDFHKELPRGEKIIFDRKILVRFNQEANLLEVIIGQVVEKFSQTFLHSNVKDESLYELTSTFKNLEIDIFRNKS